MWIQNKKSSEFFLESMRYIAKVKYSLLENKKKMKKFCYGVLFLAFLSIFLSWCWWSKWSWKVKDYNNTLMTIQEKSVDTLKDYYKSLEKDYDGTNLISMFTWTLDSLNALKWEAQSISWWEWDDTLKEAVVEYISWMTSAFAKYELPVVEILVDYTGQVSRFYKDNEELFSQSAMKLAWELAVLDKSLEGEYTQFAEKYGYYEEN